MDSGDVGVGGGDRLSKLGDAALGHILSFLPAAEAARTATLSRRWRHVFAAVHTLSFDETEACFRMGYRWWKRSFVGGGNNDVRTPRLVAGVSAALHSRHRGTPVPLRALRVTFDDGFRGGHNATTALDGWLSYVVHGGAGAGEALEIDLRLNTKQVCKQAYALASSAGGHDDAKMAQKGNANAFSDEGEYIMPRSLFSSCAVLRTLRFGGCGINLPSSVIALPSLHTLHLTRVTGPSGTIQRLVGACGASLVDLTLEACEDLTELSIDGARLRRLALRCCHALASVNVDAPELQAFEYRGDAPAEPPAPPFLTLHSARKIVFCAIDFCGVERAPVAFGEVFGLLELFAGVERLHLTSARLGSSFVSHDGVFPCFPKLRNLEITGMLPDHDDDASAAIWTASRVLAQTPRLETLSLFFLPEPDPVKEHRIGPQLQLRRVQKDATHKLAYNPYACLDAMPPRHVEVPCCLRKTAKEINLVHFQGSLGQRALAKFLLCNAPVVDEVCWKVARGPLSIQTKLMEEIKGWVMNKSAKIMFF